jgi:hypothetical protein
LALFVDLVGSGFLPVGSAIDFNHLDL